MFAPHRWLKVRSEPCAGNFLAVGLVSTGGCWTFLEQVWHLADFKIFPQFFGRSQQQILVEEVRESVRIAPFFTPTMPRTGKPFSVRMTNLGPLGWVSDREQGYRYQAAHPITGRPWPAIPSIVLDLWR